MQLAHDTWLLFVRNIATTLRTPIWVIVGLFQPLCFLFFFAPFLEGLVGIPGFPKGSAIDVFTPGMLVMLGLFGAAFVGFGLIGEMRSGFLERLQVTPVSRLALLLGRAFRDVAILLVQSVVLVALAALFGFRTNPAGMALGLVLMVLIGLLTASASYAIALTVKSEDELASVSQAITIPLLLLSGITLPLSLAPGWIQGIALLNPFAYATDAIRALSNGDLANVVVLRGFAVIGVVMLLCLLWAVRSFKNAVA